MHLFTFSITVLELWLKWLWSIETISAFGSVSGLGILHIPKRLSWWSNICKEGYTTQEGRGRKFKVKKLSPLHAGKAKSGGKKCKKRGEE